MKSKQHKPVKQITNGARIRLDHETIAAQAYSIWEQNGRAQNQEVENWLRAESQHLQAGELNAARE